MEKEEFDKLNLFGIGKPNGNFAQYFIGNSYLNPLTEFGKCPVFLANVTFEPRCRNNWHGAKSNSWFSHIAVEVPGEEASNEWCEPVTDEEYNKLEA